jgi:PIN domain nuclease of toxin-antitoxin system
MTAILLDTHVALWLDAGRDELPYAMRETIDSAWRGGGTIFFSAVSAWEIALLVEGGRVNLDLPAQQWIDRFLSRPGIEQAYLDCRIATLAYRLYHLPHRDPADRLLIATAIALNCSLVTYDQSILDFASRHGPEYGFSIVQ